MSNDFPFDQFINFKENNTLGNNISFQTEEQGLPKNSYIDTHLKESYANFDLMSSSKESIKKLQILRYKNKSNPKKVMVILSIFGSSPIVAGKDTSGNSFIEILNSKNIANNFTAISKYSISLFATSSDKSSDE